MTKVKCTNCGLKSPAFERYGGDKSGLHENGIVIALNSIGYYGGFLDSEWGDLENEKVAHLCHDCSLLLMRTMSGLAKYLMPNRGGHPFQGGSEAPCCEYTWSFHSDENWENRKIILGTTEGTWEIGKDFLP